MRTAATFGSFDWLVMVAAAFAHLKDLGFHAQGVAGEHFAVVDDEVQFPGVLIVAGHRGARTTACHRVEPTRPTA